MKKINIAFLLILLILITGCSNKENKKEEKTNSKQELSCTGSSIDNGMSTTSRINITYEDNKIVSGKFIVELELPEDAETEEKEMLKNFSLCSTDYMDKIANYGKCTTEVNETKLKSTLTIDKSLVEKYSIKDLKEALEKNKNINGKCTIK